MSINSVMTTISYFKKPAYQRGKVILSIELTRLECPRHHVGSRN